ncbi:Alkyl hydroperoxide reductase AhpD [Caulifigura coniformis]|uniref:Alkyl hydroperoxide reductase AhpD n=1 Tax=Caulifigura coniformis TaxID=2527983 RepID=A0A517SCE7_9PLAN|nr:carboxymuconolactone decarboxylase family protein [Caulifigura coniformis]QDT53810.1 Alkyl hydroperoxide reductase AhpD [Caulifigura coniformis]
MPTLDELKSLLNDDTKDLRLNLGSVLDSGDLEPQERYAIALCSAVFLKETELAEALIQQAGTTLSPEAIADAKGAAAIMGMNTVFYRFRHMIGKESYTQRPAGLRMSRMSKPAVSKKLFEMCSMACAVLAGCEMCIRAHENSLLHEDVTEDRVQQVVRIAAVVQGFVVAVAAARVGA